MKRAPQYLYKCKGLARNMDGRKNGGNIAISLFLKICLEKHVGWYKLATQQIFQTNLKK